MKLRHPFEWLSGPGQKRHIAGRWGGTGGFFWCALLSRRLLECLQAKAHSCSRQQVSLPVGAAEVIGSLCQLKHNSLSV